MCRVLIVLSALCAIAYGAQLRRPFPKLGGRIVGGEDADIKDLPYQLGMQRDGRPYCGASIISKNWALTAAHCVYNTTVSRWSFRAGSSIKGKNGTVHQAVELVVHPTWGTHGLDCDYALLKVGTPFPIGQPGVNTIGLAESEPKEGQIGVVSGWGALSTGGPSPSHLQKVEVPIISRETCGDIGADVTENMICAVLAEGGKDACQGDSGGPLAVDGTLVGIVSWGFICGAPNKPGVYANVPSQRDWIRKVSGV